MMFYQITDTICQHKGFAAAGPTELLPILEEQDDYSNDALYAVLTDYVAKKGCKNGYVMWPVRTAVSGKQMTPAGATEIMEVLGKEEALRRIGKGIEKLRNA